jgi:MFS transporter, FHS family, glucose/mannose:H+ symporter
MKGGLPQVPGLAYASSFLWVMVVGLLGPSVPAIIKDLGITYVQAGFFFTLLSLGSLVGTSLGAAASDVVPRKALYGGCVAAFCVCLATFVLVRSYVSVALAILAVSLLGSPIEAIGQSIMLDIFPDRREMYLSFLASFAAAGSILAPLLISANYTVSLGWRWPFVETGALCFALFVVVAMSSFPRARASAHREGIGIVLKNRRVAFCVVLIFFSAAIHLGFAYWVAQYFASELGVDPRLASAAAGIYLSGLFAGRLIITVLIRSVRLESILIMGLSTSLASILAFIILPSVAVKVALCAVYGIGVGPLFPLVMAWGSREFPSRPGAVTSVLWASLSLGGVVFPLLVGSIASSVGILRSFYFCAVVAGALLASLFVAQLRTGATKNAVKQ